MISSRWQTLRAALVARFDDAALRPFEAGAAAADAWPALRQWCVSGAGPLAVVTCAATELATARQAAAQVGLDLDGSRQLQACRGGLARFALRLRVKLQDACGGVAELQRAIWDSGWVPDEAAAWQALAAWSPRRPSFIVLADAPTHTLQVALQALAARSAGFAHPVRVLLLLPPGAEAGLAALHNSRELAPPDQPYRPA